MRVEDADGGRHRGPVDPEARMAVDDPQRAARPLHAFASFGGSPAAVYATREWSMLRSVKVKLLRILARS
jgi:hypothetical protein